nr:tetratricopeptide repeat protein [Corynebacterium sp. c6VSa_13]
MGALAASRSERSSDGVVEVSAQTVQEEVIAQSQRTPVVVLIGSERSPECATMRGDLARIAAQSQQAQPQGGFVLRYVDADSSPELAQAFGVAVVPTVVVIAGGQPVTSFEGPQPAEALEQWAQALLAQLGGAQPGQPGQEPREPRDPRFDAAEEALEAGDAATAIDYYDQLLAEDPHNSAAAQARGSARLIQRLGTPAESGDELAEQLAAADAEVVSGKVEQAFARLVGLLAGPHRDAARERLLELFGLFAPDDPRVSAARSAMANALF